VLSWVIKKGGRKGRNGVEGKSAGNAGRGKHSGGFYKGWSVRPWLEDNLSNISMGRWGIRGKQGDSVLVCGRVGEKRKGEP